MDHAAITTCLENHFNDVTVLVTNDVGAILHFNKNATEELAAMTAIVSFNVKQLGEYLQQQQPQVLIFAHEDNRYAILFLNDELILIKVNKNVMLSNITTVLDKLNSLS